MADGSGIRTSVALSTTFPVASDATKSANDPLPAPKARKPEGPLGGGCPANRRHGYFYDPKTKTHYSGGMEIAPPERS